MKSFWHKPTPQDFWKAPWDDHATHVREHGAFRRAAHKLFNDPEHDAKVRVDFNRSFYGQSSLITTKDIKNRYAAALYGGAPHYIELTGRQHRIPLHKMSLEELEWTSAVEWLERNEAAKQEWPWPTWHGISDTEAHDRAQYRKEASEAW